MKVLKFFFIVFFGFISVFSVDSVMAQDYQVQQLGGKIWIQGKGIKQEWQPKDFYFFESIPEKTTWEFHSIKKDSKKFFTTQALAEHVLIAKAPVQNKDFFDEQEEFHFYYHVNNNKILPLAFQKVVKRSFYDNKSMETYAPKRYLLKSFYDADHAVLIDMNSNSHLDKIYFTKPSENHFNLHINSAKTTMQLDCDVSTLSDFQFFSFFPKKKTQTLGLVCHGEGDQAKLHLFTYNGKAIKQFPVIHGFSKAYESQQKVSVKVHMGFWQLHEMAKLDFQNNKIQYDIAWIHAVDKEYVNSCHLPVYASTAYFKKNDKTPLVNFTPGETLKILLFKPIFESTDRSSKFNPLNHHTPYKGYYYIMNQDGVAGWMESTGQNFACFVGLVMAG